MLDVLLFASSVAISVWPKKATKVSDLAPTIRFGSTPLVGLLFAASWCDDCWETVPLVEQVAAASPQVMTVYYISSDRTAEQMQEYCSSVFGNIPFAQEKERSAHPRREGR